MLDFFIITKVLSAVKRLRLKSFDKIFNKLYTREVKNTKNLRLRRLITFLVAMAGVGVWLVLNPTSYEPDYTSQEESSTGAVSLGETTSNADQLPSDQKLAREVLKELEIKGRAPKTNYDRGEQFYATWPNVNGCSLRQIIIRREVGESAVMNGCDVIAGSFIEPYTGKMFVATQKSDFSNGIQIDHIVALSDAWQKGAQLLTADERYALATDPLNLIAADAAANQQKSDGDAATWLPANKAFRCQYVARQVSVKYKYRLWVTEAEAQAITKVLDSCPNEPAIGI